MSVYSPSHYGGSINYSAADSQYRQVFQELLGLNVTADDRQAIEQRIAGLPCRLMLLVALDHWAFFTPDQRLVRHLASRLSL